MMLPGQRVGLTVFGVIKYLAPLALLKEMVLVSRVSGTSLSTKRCNWLTLWSVWRGDCPLSSQSKPRERKAIRELFNSQ